MAFPITGDRFPSDDWMLAFDQYNANDAWYSGDQAKLQIVYAAVGGERNRGDNEATHYNKRDRTVRRGGLRGVLGRFFNGQIVEQDQKRTRIHAPIAGNLATLSSDLLMAEPPVFRLIDAHGKPLKDDRQARLDVMLNGEDTHRTLSHAAELTAGLSATVLTANYDKSVSDRPWMDVAACDAAIPEFRAGRLVAVNLYTQHDSLTSAGEIQYRMVHIERHEIGRIIHGVVRLGAGDDTVAGTVPLGDLEATAHIPLIPGSIRGDIENTVVLLTGIDTLTAQWWRNLPTKTFRKYGDLAMLGRADFEGVEQLLDSADEVWSSWMRDIKIARARLIVPETFLDVQGPGLGGQFDMDQELLTPLQFTDLGPDQGKISAHQFEIRFQEHAGTLLALTKEITQHAGYSMSTYGEQQGSPGGSATATEVTDRTTLTERTRDKKFLYFEQAANPLARTLMQLDALHFSGKSIDADSELTIEIPDLSQIDPEKQARVFQYLRTAMAASTDTIVREKHPDWDETQINREVLLIQTESNITSEIDAETGRVDPTGPEEDPTNPGFDTDGNPMPAVDPSADPVPAPVAA